MKANAYRAIDCCRLCGSQDLEEVWDLGEQWVMDCLEEGQDGFKAPLVVVLCRGCGLAQLQHTVDRDLLYKDYWYRSGTSETMRAALKDVADAAIERGKVKARDLVIDIGSNDSTLLNNYPPGVVCIGFEPAQNIDTRQTHRSGKLNDPVYYETTDADERFTIKDFFSIQAYLKQFPKAKMHRAKAITSIAMFYDVDEPGLFIHAVTQLLARDGVWINQMNFVEPVMRHNAFDFLSAEHIALWDLSTFAKAVAKAGLEVFDLKELPLNGGTYRVYVGHRGRWPVSRWVADYLEMDGQYTSASAWQWFKRRVERNGEHLRGLLRDIRPTGKVVAVLGASTRGNSLLQYYGLSVADLPYASDRDPNKWGKTMVGTNIPIVSEEEARQRKPDYFLVLPYTYIEQIKARERDFLSRGGRFIIPLPDVTLEGALDA